MDDASLTQAELLTLDCLNMMAEAKSTLVHIDGIGAELLPTIVAYEGNTAIGYAMLHSPPATPEAFMRSMGTVASLMVAGWHATGLAIVLESYAETSEPFSPVPEGTSLAERFATDPTIEEALWVAYADRLGGTSMGVTTYHQTVGRIVNYDEPVLSTPDQNADFQTEGSIPHLLCYNLSNTESKPAPTDATLDECRSAIATRIHQLGYAVYLPNDTIWGSSQLHPD
jgi:hypothetical protein